LNDDSWASFDVLGGDREYGLMAAAKDLFPEFKVKGGTYFDDENEAVD